MTTHESQDQAQHNIEPGSDRSFGLIVGGVLAAIAGYQFLNSAQYYLWFAIPGAVLILLGLIAPSTLHTLNILWMKLGLLLGRIVTPIVMFLVYVITIVPIGLMLRLSGKNLLQLKQNADTDSYWIARTPHGPAPDSLKDQF